MAANPLLLSFLSYDLTLITDYIKVIEEFRGLINDPQQYPIYETSIDFIIEGLKIHLNYQYEDTSEQIQNAIQASSSLDSIIINSGSSYIRPLA
ncbi:MAG: hypothetical protein AAGA16_20210 [Cyanobacteria bacterium P01_E01_bin.35]